MRRTRYSRARIRTAMMGLFLCAAFWVVALGVAIPLGAQWPEGFPEIDIGRDQLSPFIGGQPHPPVYRAAQTEWEGWVWFATLILAVTFLWEKCWMMWHFTPRWGGLERSIFAVNAVFLVIYLRSLTATLYPEFGRDVDFWVWAMRLNVWILIAVLAWGLFQILLIEDPDEERA